MITRPLSNIGATVQHHLDTVQQTVSTIFNPATRLPIQLPDYELLRRTAGTLDSTSHAAEKVFMISSLLGRASSVDMETPPSDYAVAFPHDHHFHANMGFEWYWIACHLKVIDRHGLPGRVSVLFCTEKTRSVGLAAQRTAGWSDEQATVAGNVATVTVDMGPGARSYYRRTPNYQWPATGGDFSFSRPGDTAFHVRCGGDSISGPLDVLPLSLAVNDGDNMRINLTLGPGPNVDATTASFMQGMPSPLGNGGTGVTPLPTPGIYYSWPQLAVTGTVTVGGMEYLVQSGSGWMDHQLMMTSLENSGNVTHQLPFLEDPAPYNGWVWQFYNLESGQAFTGAGFIVGQMNDSPAMVYGYFLQPNGSGGWTAIFINGQIGLTDPQSFPPVCDHPHEGTPVAIPILRSYTKVENIFLGDPLSGNATPWYRDGTFNSPGGALCAEFPADYADTTGKYTNGVGYMETVGFQETSVLRAYLLSFLQR